MGTDEQDLLTSITRKYLTSGDFNGLPTYQLSASETQDQIRSLISKGLVDLVRGDFHPNPHIKALQPDPIALQLKKIEDFGVTGCLYPSPDHLRTVVRRSSYPRRPFTYAMAMGMPQLEAWPFDIRAMEWYRNDPRFEVRIDDISFSITIKDEFASRMARDDRDNISIDRAGFCYNAEDQRALAVFARDLSTKPDHHQMQWHPFILDGDFRLQEDFFVSTVLGDWPRGISVFDAFLEERKTVNLHLEKQGKRKFFKSEYESGDRPDRFGFIIRPTSRELNEFHQTLDKILSDDISRSFFDGVVETFEIVARADGTAKKLPHGTIQMTKDWLQRDFPDEPRAAAFLHMLRAARERRQRPAHQISSDNFNQSYVLEQRDIMKRAYEAIHGFRHLLQQTSGGPLSDQSSWLDEVIVRFK